MRIKALLFLLLFFPFMGKAQLPCRNDECYKVVTPENYKLSKREFIARYSNGNDTTAAIIRYFFAKRRNAMLKIGLPLVATAGAAVLIKGALDGSKTSGDSARALAYGAPALSLLFLPAGVNDLREFNRENLLFTIIDFQRRNGLADRYFDRLKKYYTKK